MYKKLNFHKYDSFKTLGNKFSNCAISNLMKLCNCHPFMVACNLVQHDGMRRWADFCLLCLLLFSEKKETGIFLQVTGNYRIKCKIPANIYRT